MKLNTHDRTPKPKNSKSVTALWVIYAILICGISCISIYAGFAYSKTPFTGILLILLYAVIAVVALVPLKDMKKAYIEISENQIHVVDYYFGIKKEKLFSFSDITSAEVCLGYSHSVKGYRYNALRTRYIVFRNGTMYLFKIIYLPETEEIFKRHLQSL